MPLIMGARTTKATDFRHLGRADPLLAPIHVHFSLMSSKIVDDTRTRLRLLGVLFASAGISRTGYIAAFTVAALVAEDMLGSPRWSGLAAAFTTLGIAAGTNPVSALMNRTGRRIGMVASYGVAFGGALVAIIAIEIGSLALFLAAMFVFGAGASGDRLGRYAAADVAPRNRHASAISSFVFAGTIGAVLAPLLLSPAKHVAESIGLNGLSGGFLIALAASSFAIPLVAIMLRPDPLTFTDRHVERADRAVSILSLLERPIVVYGLVSLAISQSVMVLIMAMTPVHIRAATDDALRLIGLVMAAHTFGMFFLSPVTGWLVDRFGALHVILAGQAILVFSALLTAPASGDELRLLMPGLFLLGLGWNFGFVGGSALINEVTEGSARLRLQGFADSVTWISGAVAGVSSGLLLDARGFMALSVVGAVLVLIPLGARLRIRR